MKNNLDENFVEISLPAMSKAKEAVNLFFANCGSPKESITSVNKILETCKKWILPDDIFCSKIESDEINENLINIQSLENLDLSLLAISATTTPSVLYSFLKKGDNDKSIYSLQDFKTLKYCAISYFSLILSMAKHNMSSNIVADSLYFLCSSVGLLQIILDSRAQKLLQRLLEINAPFQYTRALSPILLNLKNFIGQNKLWIYLCGKTEYDNFHSCSYSDNEYAKTLPICKIYSIPPVTISELYRNDNSSNYCFPALTETAEAKTAIQEVLYTYVDLIIRSILSSPEAFRVNWAIYTFLEKAFSSPENNPNIINDNSTKIDISKIIKKYISATEPSNTPISELCIQISEFTQNQHDEYNNSFLNNRKLNYRINPCVNHYQKVMLHSSNDFDSLDTDSHDHVTTSYVVEDYVLNDNLQDFIPVKLNINPWIEKNSSNNHIDTNESSNPFANNFKIMLKSMVNTVAEPLITPLISKELLTNTELIINLLDNVLAFAACNILQLESQFVEQLVLLVTIVIIHIDSQSLGQAALLQTINASLIRCEHNILKNKSINQSSDISKESYDTLINNSNCLSKTGSLSDTDINEDKQDFNNSKYILAKSKNYLALVSIWEFSWKALGFLSSIEVYGSSKSLNCNTKLTESCLELEKRYPNLIEIKSYINIKDTMKFVLPWMRLSLIHRLIILLKDNSSFLNIIVDYLRSSRYNVGEYQEIVAISILKKIIDEAEDYIKKKTEVIDDSHLKKDDFSSVNELNLNIIKQLFEIGLPTSLKNLNIKSFGIPNLSNCNELTEEDLSSKWRSINDTAQSPLDTIKGLEWYNNITKADKVSVPWLIGFEKILIKECKYIASAFVGQDPSFAGYTLNSKIFQSSVYYGWGLFSSENLSEAKERNKFPYNSEWIDNLRDTVRRCNPYAQLVLENLSNIDPGYIKLLEHIPAPIVATMTA